MHFPKYQQTVTAMHVTYIAYCRAVWDHDFEKANALEKQYRDLYNKKMKYDTKNLQRVKNDNK